MGKPQRLRSMCFEIFFRQEGARSIRVLQCEDFLRKNVEGLFTFYTEISILFSIFSTQWAMPEVFEPPWRRPSKHVVNSPKNIFCSGFLSTITNDMSIYFGLQKIIIIKESFCVKICSKRLQLSSNNLGFGINFLIVNNITLAKKSV